MYSLAFSEMVTGILLETTKTFGIVYLLLIVMPDRFFSLVQRRVVLSYAIRCAAEKGEATQ